MHTQLVASSLTLDIVDGAETRRLLDNISFTVNGGEIVGVTGPSGSGKSTLMAIIGALQQATEGSAQLRTAKGRTVELTAYAPSSHKAALLRREHVGIVFQQANLLPSLTALDQLLVMPRLARVLPFGSSAWRRQKDEANQLLADVGLEGMGNRAVSQLSGGQQARINLARALMNDPDVLLIDEPTAALDSVNATMVTDLIREVVHSRGIPALYVSHDAKQLSSLDRIIRIEDGQLVDSQMAMSA